MKKKYDVVGMTCSACSTHVDKAVRGLDELENAKNNIIGKWAFTTETNNQQACILAHHGIMGLGFDFLEKTKQAVKAVTSEQLQQCANRYFNDNYVYAVLKP